LTHLRHVADIVDALASAATILQGFEMETYILLGAGLGLGLLIAIWGIWNLRGSPEPRTEQRAAKGVVSDHEVERS
jgi:hypothetical protein